jgi:hypothetical protein
VILEAVFRGQKIDPSDFFLLVERMFYEPAYKKRIIRKNNVFPDNPPLNMSVFTLAAVHSKPIPARMRAAEVRKSQLLRRPG